MTTQSLLAEILPSDIDYGSYKGDDDHISVKTDVFVSRSAFPCDLFVPVRTGSGEVELREAIKQGESCDDSVISLFGNGISELYARKEDEDRICEYLRGIAGNIVLSNSVSPGTKCRIICSYAESVVRKVFRERPQPGNVSMGREVVGSISFLLSSGKVVPEVLLSAFSNEYHVFSHSAQVAILGMAFCNSLKMPKEQVLNFGLGALFHDIGKNPDENKALDKSSRWDVEEFEVLKKHTTAGYQRLLSTQAMTEDQLDVVLHHHEAYDGSGYPAGLKGNQISAPSRVARIVDVYDTLTTKRPHKKKLSGSDALSLMKEDMKSTFDPDLLKSFLGFMGMEEKMKSTITGDRINIEMGSQLHIQCDADIRFKAILIGIDAPEFMIVRSPGSAQLRSQFYEGRPVVVKCVHSGSVYGFRSKVLCHVLHPNVRMLVMAYPDKIEAINLRKDPRICCYLPVELSVGDSRHGGIIVDLSTGGCRLVVKHPGKGGLRARIDEEVVINIPAFGDDESERFSGTVKSLSIDEQKAAMGIKFAGLSEGNKNTLEQFVGSILDVVRNNEP